MSASPSLNPRSLLPWLAGFVVLLSPLLAVSWSTGDLAAQNPAKPAKEEQEEPPKATKGTGKKPPAREEEEEPTRPKRRVPLRVGDEEMESKQPASSLAKPGVARITDLAEEAKRAKHPVLQELYRNLAVAHDVVTSPMGTFYVEPVAKLVGTPPKLKGSITLQTFNEKWAHGRSFSVSSREIAGIDPYEHIALTKVDEFLKSGLDKEPEGSKKYMPRPEMLQEAEKIVAAVILFHESAVERGQREGEEWKKQENALRAKLQSVQLDQLRLLTDAKKWEDAFDLATRLKEAYPKQTKVLAEIARLAALNAEQALQDHEYAAARKRLLVLEDEFPNNPDLERIRGRLKDKAAALKQEAENLVGKGDSLGAIALLESARSIYPQLPGLHDYYLELNRRHPILYVGVRDLPENLSPATAYTDSEKQAVELLFESLVKLAYNPSQGLRYEAGLAGDLPRLTPLGREFQLQRGAFWSDGRLVTAADVRNTVRLLSDREWPGHVPEWADMMQQGARIGRDAFHINLTLRQGFLDPLSFMDFKVLPEHQLKHADDASFAKEPIGSGPFRFKARDKDRVVFRANPLYESRPGKAGLPRIIEIHFIHSDNPALDFQDDKLRLHLLLDLPTQKFKELNSAGLKNVKLQTLPNRRVYFLAVNHRRPALQNVALRRAIAHGINREETLKRCFREGFTPRPHQALNGPYPPDSWAVKRSLQRDPYSLNLAQAQAQKARGDRKGPLKLTLKYPEGDPAVKQACQEIRKQISALGGLPDLSGRDAPADGTAPGISPGVAIDLELVARPPRELRREVEETHEYDLAYYHYDFPNESYWLWPLFDPQATGAGGRNFLGYQNDDELENLFRKVMTHREFRVVQDLTQSIHEALYERVPLIPLWQLDTHLAIHKNLTIPPGPLDPLLIFNNVERWSLDSR